MKTARGQSVFGFVAVTVGIIAFVGVTGFVLNDYSLNMYSYFAPKYANVQRQVFENTHGYNMGMNQEIEQEHGSYIRVAGDKVKMAAICDNVLAEVGDDAHPELLPQSTQDFIEECRHNRGGY